MNFKTIFLNNPMKSSITREKFLYKYLVEYNKHEKLIRSKYGNNISQGFIQYDDANSTDGVFVYVIRNLLAHDTKSMLDSIESNKISYNTLLKNCATLKVDNRLKIDILEIMFNSSKIEEEFKSNGYELFKSENPKNIYYCFQKKVKGIYINIFLHKQGKFIDCSLNTYNHNEKDGAHDFYNDTMIYLETEKNKDDIYIRFFDYSKSENLKPRVDVSLKINNKLKNFKSLADDLTISILESGKYVTYHFARGQDTEYDIYIDSIDAIIDKIKDYFDVNTLNTIIRDVTQEYKNINQVLQKIGFNI